MTTKRVEPVTSSPPEYTGTVTNTPLLKRRPVVQPKVSRAEVNIELALLSKESQRVYDQNFRYVARSFMNLSVRNREHPMFKSQKKQDLLDRILDYFRVDWLSLTREVGTAIQQMRILLDNEGIHQDEWVTYSTPLILRERLTTPDLKHHIRLLQQLDQLVIHIDSLWIHQILPERDARQKKKDYVNAAIKLGNRLSNFDSSLTKLVRDRNIVEIDIPAIERILAGD